MNQNILEIFSGEKATLESVFLFSLSVKLFQMSLIKHLLRLLSIKRLLNYNTIFYVLYDAKIG